MSGTQQSQLQAICANATAALFIMDEHNHCTYMNPAAEALTGYRVDELTDRPLHDLIHHSRPDGSAYPMHECPIGKALLAGGQALGEEVFVHKDGHFYDVAFAASLIREDGRTVGTVLEVQDITARKRREADLSFLSEIAEEFTRLTSLEQVLAIVPAKIGRYLQVSSCLLCEVGQDSERLSVDHRWQRDDMPSPQDTEQIADCIAAAADDSMNVGAPAVIADAAGDPRLRARGCDALAIGALLAVPFHRDGAWCYLLAVTERQPRQWLDSEVQLLSELSNRMFPRLDRLRAEQALRASEARYRMLFESIEQGFAVLDVLFDDHGRPYDFRCVEVNPAFERHTGLRDAVGRRASELVPGLERHWIDACGRVATRGRPEHYVEYSATMGRWFEEQAFRIGDAAQRRVAVLFSDISERKRFEQALQDANQRLRQSDRRKDEFLAMLAHELRNPLAPISMAAQLLQVPDLEPQRARHAGSIIARQAEHMTSLVNDLLDVSRVTRGLITLDREPLELRTVLAHAVEQVRPLIDARAHRLDVQLGGTDLWLHGDRTRLVQIVVNLLNNAARFTPDGGRIELCVERHGDQARVLVSDDGIGIDPPLLPQVFELFAQGARTPDRAYGGLGLGLALVRSLVELHGGGVEAHSEGRGRGSRFGVWLPLAMPPRASLDDDAHEPEATARQVVVVDDNLDAAHTLADLLRAHGHHVRVRGDAQAALDADDAPEVYILDIGLPGMDGYALVGRLRERHRERVPMFIALTGYGQPADLARSQAAGFRHHFVKPVDLQQLMQAMAEPATA